MDWSCFQLKEIKILYFQNLDSPVVTIALSIAVFIGVLFWIFVILTETAAEKFPIKKVVVFLYEIPTLFGHFEMVHTTLLVAVV